MSVTVSTDTLVFIWIQQHIQQQGKWLNKRLSSMSSCRLNCWRFTTRRPKHWSRGRVTWFHAKTYKNKNTFRPCYKDVSITGNTYLDLFGNGTRSPRHVAVSGCHELVRHSSDHSSRQAEALDEFPVIITIQKVSGRQKSALPTEKMAMHGYQVECHFDTNNNIDLFRSIMT